MGFPCTLTPYLTKKYHVFKEMRKIENMPMGLDRCNGLSRYMCKTLPPSLLRQT
jgi:hypothetical protein